MSLGLNEEKTAVSAGALIPVIRPAEQQQCMHQSSHDSRYDKHIDACGGREVQQQGCSTMLHLDSMHNP